MRKLVPSAHSTEVAVKRSEWQKDDKNDVQQDDLYANVWMSNFRDIPFDMSPTNEKLLHQIITKLAPFFPTLREKIQKY